ncbi:MAG: hypothetical protein OXI10_12350, partial [Gammaproteobacteria bacterium]|nr:hypothetical protein [Gammaproteobacteria bacterium]
MAGSRVKLIRPLSGNNSADVHDFRFIIFRKVLINKCFENILVLDSSQMKTFRTRVDAAPRNRTDVVFHP